MNPSVLMSALAMRGSQQAMDIISNNLANLQTAGYKRREAAFGDLFLAYLQQPSTLPQEGRLTVDGLREGNGVRLTGTLADWRTGAARETGRELDFFIEGDAFFAIEGTGGETWYTRDGNFHLSPAEGGQWHLVTASGNRLLGTDGQPLALPPFQSLTVDSQGRITVEQENGTMTTLEPAIALVRFRSPDALETVGQNRYRIPDAIVAGIQPEDTPLWEAVAPEQRGAGNVAIRQKFLESANVDLAWELTRLIQAQRAYQLNAQVLSSADRMMGLANSLRG
jgi:flagellar basal-body rod protein FlgG